MTEYSKHQSIFLNELIKDCIIFRLNENEALKYIEIRFGQEICAKTYYNRKSKLEGESSTKIWLSYLSRIGFVLIHKKLMEITERLIDSSMNELFHEYEKPYAFEDRDTNEVKPYELKNDAKVFRLRNDVRENIKLMRELLMDSPFIAEIKGHLESGFKLRLRLLEEYGMDVDDNGNINYLNRSPNSGNSKRNAEDDPEAVF